MATFFIVAKDLAVLQPGEIRAGGTIQVNDGDVFIIRPGVKDNIKFETPNAPPKSFEIRLTQNNSNDFDIEIETNLDATINISNNVKLPNLDIKADDARSVTLTAGDDVSLGKYDGSKTGSDTLTFGDNFTTTHDIKTEGGNDSITFGDNANIEKIDTGDGGDAITFGDGAVVDEIDTGDGDDSITAGDDFTADKIETKDGNDSLTIGDGGVVDDINTGEGNDRVFLGDDFTGDKLETKDGNDFVRIGTGAEIDDLDGGNGDDSLASGTQGPTPLPGSNFETFICFARGTPIRTSRGDVPVEGLSVGDRVETLDHGFQQIRWIGSSAVAGTGALAPVRIAAGALGNRRDLWLSQQHRIMLGDWRTELFFGETQVLVAAKQLVYLPGITIVEVPRVEYFHILFDRHEIVFSEGIATESYHPAQVGLGSLSEGARAEIFALFPELRTDPGAFSEAARPILKAHEGHVLAA